MTTEKKVYVGLAVIAVILLTILVALQLTPEPTSGEMIACMEQQGRQFASYDDALRNCAHFLN